MLSSNRSPGHVVVYAANSDLASRLSSALVTHRPTTVTMWSALEGCVARARCIVVGDCAPRHSDLPNRLRRLAQSATSPEMLAVTTPDAESVRTFVASGVSAVLWVNDAPAALDAAVERALRRQPLEALAQAFTGADHLPLYLRNTLGHLCRAPHGMRTVHELCEAAGCHRSTLWAQWRGSVAESKLRLQDVVDWVLLLRACGLRSPDVTWASVADQMRVHEHTVARIAKRLMGCGLRDLRHPLAAAAVHDALLARLVPMLTASAGTPGQVGLRDSA